MERKEFIKQISMLTLGGCFISAALQACSQNIYNAKYTLNEKEIKVLKSEFYTIENMETKYRDFVLIKPEQLNFPICIYRINESEYSALLMSCTHNGCELHANKETLVCPCHGSEFSNKGAVMSPPAEHNLTTYKITNTNDAIIIHL